MTHIEEKDIIPLLDIVKSEYIKRIVEESCCGFGVRLKRERLKRKVVKNGNGIKVGFFI